MAMNKFEGIPAGRLGFTSVPNLLFSEWLPAAQGLAEVKVVLHLFYLLSQRKGNPRFVTFHELCEDITLMGSLTFRKDELKRGLDAGVKSGALLKSDHENTTWYFFNTPESRIALEKIDEGELKLMSDVQSTNDITKPVPNIFKIYEQQIGGLTPMIVEELKEAESEYPPEAILDAFRIAAENNVRSWKYVSKILLNWARENKNETTERHTPRKRRPSITGKLADVAKSK